MQWMVTSRLEDEEEDEEVKEEDGDEEQRVEKKEEKCEEEEEKRNQACDERGGDDEGEIVASSSRCHENDVGNSKDEAELANTQRTLSREGSPDLFTDDVDDIPKELVENTPSSAAIAESQEQTQQTIEIESESFPNNCDDNVDYKNVTD